MSDTDQAHSVHEHLKENGIVLYYCHHHPFGGDYISPTNEKIIQQQLSTAFFLFDRKVRVLTVSPYPRGQENKAHVYYSSNPLSAHFFDL